MLMAVLLHELHGRPVDQLQVVDSPEEVEVGVGVLRDSTYFSFILRCRGTGCLLNIVFFSKILIYIPDSDFSRCQCVYTHQAGRTPALQQNRQSSENSKNCKEKNNI